MNRLAQQMLEWFVSRQNPCIFARKIAITADERTWGSIIVEGSNPAPTCGKGICEHLDVLANEKKELAQIIFPDINTTSRIADLISELCKFPRWYCSAYKCPSNISRDGSLWLGLRWVLPDNMHVSWILGLAHIKSMPLTRRTAPYTALLFRLGLPGKSVGIRWKNPKEITNRELMERRIPVHLGDVTSPFADNQITPLWDKTVELRKKILTGDVFAGASHPHLTFSLPMGMRDRFDLPPESEWKTLPTMRRRIS